MNTNLKNYIEKRYTTAKWPPDFITHGPDHTAPTHPATFTPSTFLTTSTKPFVSTTTKTPVYPGLPSKFPIHTTSPSDSEMGSDAAITFGLCGQKNPGGDDQERIVGGHSAEPNEVIILIIEHGVIKKYWDEKYRPLLPLTISNFTENLHILKRSILLFFILFSSIYKYL